MYSKTITNNAGTREVLGLFRRVVVLRGIFMLLLLFSTGSAVAKDFLINSAEIVLSEKVYQLNARLEFDFSKDVMRAIDNGVPVVIELDIEILRPRNYFWDKEIATLEQRYQLQYHALSEQYIVRNLNSGAQYTFFSLVASLQKIGHVDHLPIIDEQLLTESDSEKLYARIRTQLGFDDLPVPLKLNALISRSWWLSSDWVELNF